MRHGPPYTPALASLGLLSLTLLTACDPAIRGEVSAGLARGERQAAHQQAHLDAARRGEVIIEKQPWFGRRIEVRRGSRQGKPLPKRVEGAKGLSLSIDGKADVRTIARAIEAATDIPVSVRTRYITAENQIIEVPIATRMSARHEGALSAFLDRMAARMDVAWTHDGRAIAIDRMVRREWRVPLPGSKTNVSDTIDGQGISIKSERELDPWKELEARLKPLAPLPARVDISREAGRVSVFGPPSVQAGVARVLEDVVAMASKRIALDVAVYFVTSDKADEFGVSLQNLGASPGTVAGRLVSASASAASGLANPGGTLTLTRGPASASFQALARNGAVVDYRIGSTTVQSGVIAPISLTTTRSYNRQATTSTTDRGVTTSGVETQEFRTGIIIAALPRLIDRNRLQLGLSITQRALVEFDANRFPVIDERAIRSEAVMAAGETLVVSGYEQRRAEETEQGLGILKTLGLGGRNAAGHRRVRMYVLIRPSILAAARGAAGGRS